MISRLNLLFDLFYPNLCLLCNEALTPAEEQLCFKCLGKMPRTNYHILKDNPMERRFWGKVPVEHANAYFFFRKGSELQKLMHHLKYRGNKAIGVVMGRYVTAELEQWAPLQTIDAVVPVPLHKEKLAVRGYNQSEQIAYGIAQTINKPLLPKLLVRQIAGSTQTKKSVYDRFENTRGVFALKNPKLLEHKHLLLVDDVLTTGSTLEACIQALISTEQVKVSVFTLAISDD